jgi:hypothetical protein
MTTRNQLTFAAVLTICCFGLTLAQGSLNDVKIGQCGASGTIKTWIDSEEARGLVIDSRPFAINQAKGKLLFTRGAGRIAVVHMNPFVYDYKISVAQQELVSTALTDFLKLLLPQSLGSLPGLQSGEAGTPSRMLASDKLLSIEQRLLTFNLAACNAAPNSDPAACAATAEMLRVFTEIRRSGVYAAPAVPPAAAIPLSPKLNQLLNSTIRDRAAAALLGGTEDLFKSYTDSLTRLRNEQLDTFDVCSTASTLNNTLSTYDFDHYFQTLNAAQQEITKILVMAEDLKQLGTDYNNDALLKTKTVRCSGFNCTNQFLVYAQGVLDILGAQGYQAKLDALRLKGQEMQNMFVLTEQMRQKDGLFARTFEVPKKFELSQATITVKREKLEDKNKGTGTTGSQSGNPTAPLGNGIPTPLIPGGASNQGTEGNATGSSFTGTGIQSGTAPPTAAPSGGSAATATGNNAAPTGQINEVIQIGRPRFMLSGGLVYSPLARQTFKNVKGFVLDAQGNPTGTGNANVIGLEENSSRRLLPMVLLNSRLLDYERGSLFFSLGVTGKRDDNIDLEYLVGPSVSFLNDRALFTFGAYGGLSQNLVSDVKLGDQISDDLGDAKFFRKGLTWKPGFSFSYSFSKTKKLEGTGGTGGSASVDELKNEIRLGGIPFNLALGLAYTSLEERTYDEIAGLALDRQGNLTNGRTIARIVGVTSSSNYRLTPLAMLHSRLTNFGAHDFYFTTGVTGRKTDNNLNVEYLLGGSTNLYARKVFLTLGTFIGKQQTLGGNFFEGAALGKGQNVTTIDRYVWKPALSISYDISKIIPRSQ